MYEEADQILLLTPVVTKEDLDQEMELLRLQGKNPSRSIVYKKLSRYESLLFDSIGTPDIPGAEPIPWEGEPTPTLEIMTQLISWAIQQSIQIQNVVLSFLEGRSDESETVEKLISLGIISRQNKRLLRSGGEFTLSLTDIILKKLEESVQVNIKDLYRSAREFTVSKRPEAAVRQIMRRFIRLGIVTRISEDVYSLSR